MRKVVGKAFTAGGMFDFFLDSAAGEHFSLSPRVTGHHFGAPS